MVRGEYGNLGGRGAALGRICERFYPGGLLQTDNITPAGVAVFPACNYQVHPRMCTNGCSIKGKIYPVPDRGQDIGGH